jgi:hypothetical protein
MNQTRSNRTIRSGYAPLGLPLLPASDHKSERSVRTRRLIKIENDATRATPDSWADIERERKRVDRISKIRAAWDRTKPKP